MTPKGSPRVSTTQKDKYDKSEPNSRSESPTPKGRQLMEGGAAKRGTTSSQKPR